MEKARFFKLLGIMLMGIIVLGCTPKKSAEQSANAAATEARIAQLEAALAALAKDEAEEEAVETATPERTRERRERRERRSELLAQLETAQTELETVAATPPPAAQPQTPPSTTTPPAKTTVQTQTPATPAATQQTATTTPTATPTAQQQPSGGNQDPSLVGTWYKTIESWGGNTVTLIQAFNSNGTSWDAGRWDPTGEFSRNPVPSTWSTSGNKLTMVKQFEEGGGSIPNSTNTYSISGNKLTFTGMEYTRGDPLKAVMPSLQTTAEDQFKQQQLVGTWKAIGSYDIFLYNADGSWRKDTIVSNTSTYTFNADGTGTYILRGGSGNFTWTIGEAKLHVIYHTRPGDLSKSLPFSVKDNEFSFSDVGYWRGAFTRQ